METQTEKLKIEHLAPYLPYGVKATIKPQNEIWQIEGLTCHETAYLKGGQYPCDISDIIPHFLPLSELTGRQWLQVFNAGTEGANPVLPGLDGRIENFLEYHSDFGIELIIEDESTKYSISIDYDFKNRQFSTNIRFNQVKAFNKIFEFHGDLNFLIENGLAINKITNEKNI